jgi:large subunit ribosomal protein L24
MQTKLHIRKGDVVRIISGNEKGKEGKVLRVFPARERVIVEGVNMRIRHMKRSQAYPQGGRVEREMPIHASNVMPLDHSGQPTRVGRKAIEDLETGKFSWVRVARTTGEELD